MARSPCSAGSRGTQTGGIRFEKRAGRRGRAGPPGGERRRDPKRGFSFCVHGSPVLSLLREEGVEVLWTPKGWKTDLKRYGWKNTMEEALELNRAFFL